LWWYQLHGYNQDQLQVLKLGHNLKQYHMSLIKG